MDATVTTHSHGDEEKSKNDLPCSEEASPSVSRTSTASSTNPFAEFLVEAPLEAQDKESVDESDAVCLTESVYASAGAIKSIAEHVYENDPPPLRTDSTDDVADDLSIRVDADRQEQENTYASARRVPSKSHIEGMSAHGTYATGHAAHEFEQSREKHVYSNDAGPKTAWTEPSGPSEGSGGGVVPHSHSAGSSAVISVEDVVYSDSDSGSDVYADSSDDNDDYEDINEVSRKIVQSHTKNPYAHAKEVPRFAKPVNDMQESSDKQISYASARAPPDEQNSQQATRLDVKKSTCAPQDSVLDADPPAKRSGLPRSTSSDYVDLPDISELLNDTYELVSKDTINELTAVSNKARQGSTDSSSSYVKLPKASMLNDSNYSVVTEKVSDSNLEAHDADTSTNDETQIPSSPLYAQVTGHGSKTLTTLIQGIGGESETDGVTEVRAMQQFANRVYEEIPEDFFDEVLDSNEYTAVSGGSHSVVPKEQRREPVLRKIVHGDPALPLSDTSKLASGDSRLYDTVELIASIKPQSAAQTPLKSAPSSLDPPEWHSGVRDDTPSPGSAISQLSPAVLDKFNNTERMHLLELVKGGFMSVDQALEKVEQLTPNKGLKRGWRQKILSRFHHKSDNASSDLCEVKIPEQVKALARSVSSEAQYPDHDGWVEYQPMAHILYYHMKVEKIAMIDIVVVDTDDCTMHVITMEGGTFEFVAESKEDAREWTRVLLTAQRWRSSHLPEIGVSTKSLDATHEHITTSLPKMTLTMQSAVGWKRGLFSTRAAEHLLRYEVPGSFVLRSWHENKFTRIRLLTVKGRKAKQFKHYRVTCANENEWFLDGKSVGTFSNVDDMVKRLMHDTANVLPVKLRDIFAPRTLSTSSDA